MQIRNEACIVPQQKRIIKSDSIDRPFERIARNILQIFQRFSQLLCFKNKTLHPKFLEREERINEKSFYQKLIRPKANQIIKTMKNHPVKTALVVAGLACAVIGTYYYWSSSIPTQKITIVTSSNSNLIKGTPKPEIFEDITCSTKDYCFKQGYEFKENLVGEEFGKFSKIASVRQLFADPTMKDQDWFVWLDSDVVITNEHVRFEEIIHHVKQNYQSWLESSPSIILTEDVDPRIKLNTGVMLVKNNSLAKEIMNRIWELRTSKDFSNTDFPKEALSHLPVEARIEKLILENNKFAKGIKIIPQILTDRLSLNVFYSIFPQFSKQDESFQKDTRLSIAPNVNWSKRTIRWNFLTHVTRFPYGELTFWEDLMEIFYKTEKYTRRNEKSLALQFVHNHSNSQSSI